MTKTRLFTLLITAAMFAMFVATLYRPGGLSDGGFW
jgi:hypothetical protein